MRELNSKGLFRGKEHVHDEWRYGYYYNSILPYIVTQDETHKEKLNKYMVKAETIGEFSGVLDCVKNMIFEHDIVETNIFYANIKINGVCDFQNGSFGVIWNRGGVEVFTPFSSFANSEFKVLGNIFDNKELL